jgi:hypothetical protein
MMDKPNPGSDEAIKQGCTCPVLDNGHGTGYMGQKGIFVFNIDCPVHWPSGIPSEAQAFKELVRILNGG